MGPAHLPRLLRSPAAVHGSHIKTDCADPLKTSFPYQITERGSARTTQAGGTLYRQCLVAAISCCRSHGGCAWVLLSTRGESHIKKIDVGGATRSVEKTRGPHGLIINTHMSCVLCITTYHYVLVNMSITGWGAVIGRRWCEHPVPSPRPVW